MRAALALRIFRGKIILYLQAGEVAIGSGIFTGKVAIRSAKSPLQGGISLQRAE